MLTACEGFSLAFVFIFAVGSVGPSATETAQNLSLIPFPKCVRLQKGALPLKGNLRVSVAKDARDRFAAVDLCGEISARTGLIPEICADFPSPTDKVHILQLEVVGAPQQPTEPLPLTKDKGEEAYALRVFPSGAEIQSTGAPGLFYGVQTLKQLIRANIRDGAIPCLVIEDWPSLRYRGFQDDITRAPSPLLEKLQSAAEALGAGKQLPPPPEIMM